jgi:hypothetical protein
MESKSTTLQNEYRNHIRKAADQVKSWPKWKQGEVGVTTPNTTRSSEATESFRARRVDSTSTR